MLESADAILERVEEEPVMRSLRTPLLAAALFMYLFGLFLLRLPDHSVSATITRPQRKRRWGKRRSLAPEPPRASRPPNTDKEAA